MDDYISREALIERLGKNLAACNPGTFSERCYADAIETVKHLPDADVEPVRHGRWIPCSERLPEDGGKYLVCIASEAFPGSMYIDILRYDKKGWKRDCVYAANVTHWRPLPEPPEEGD